MGNTNARASMLSSARTSWSRLHLNPSGSLNPMCVCASRGSRAGTDSVRRSNHGNMPASGTITRRRLRSFQQEMRGLAVLADEREGAHDGHEESLSMDVAGLDVGRLDLAGEHVLHLLAVLVEVRAIHHRRPDRLVELRLRVADEIAEGRVQLPEPAVESDHGLRLLHVVEARARLALRCLVLLLREQRLARRERLLRGRRPVAGWHGALGWPVRGGG